MIKECDLLLVISTSGLVYPAAYLPESAQQAGTKIIEINPDAIALSATADVRLRLGAVAGLREFFVSAG